MPFQDFTRRLQGPPQPLTLPEYDLPTQIEPMDEHQAAVEKIFGKSQPNFAVDVPDNWTVEEQKPQAQPGKPQKYQTLRDLMPKQQRKAKTISARKPGTKTGTMPGTVTARNPLTGSAFDPRPKANNEFDLSLGGPSEAEQMAERALVASGQNVGRDTSRKRSFLQKVQDRQAQDARSQRLRLEGVDTGETKFDPASLERAGELLRMRKQVESENPLTRFGRRFLTTAAGGLKPDEEFINAPVNRAEDAVNSVLDAATRGIASMPEGFARIADNFLNQGDIAAASAMQKILANHPDMTPAEKTEAQARINKLHSGLSKMGDYIEPISKMGDEAAKGLYPRDPNAEETINPLKADFWSHTMPQAAGSMLPFMAASGVGGALKIAPELVAGGAGMAMEVPDQYHEARAAGATPEQLARSVDTGMLAGGLESMGAESLMGKVGLTGKSIPGHVAKEALQEFGQEGAQSLVEDLGAKYYSGHKPELTAGQMTMNALQNAVPALFLGAGGGAMGIPAHLAERNHQKIAQQIEQVATTQPDHPVAQTIAAAGIDPTTVSKADDKAIEQLSIRLEAMAKMDSQIQQLQGQQTQVQQQVLNAQQAQQMGRVPSTVEAQAVQQAPVVEQQLAEAEAQQAAIVQDLQQNVSPLFKNLAKAIGKSEAQPISDVADDPKANLLTEVRKAGGISAGEGTVEKGELDRLGIKEAGTTGVISRTGGESADRMRERMASEGLTEAETPQQFIGELEAATKKGKTEAESYADYQRSQMTEQEIADSDKLDEVLADKTHPFTQIYRTLDNPKTIFTKDLAKKFDAAAQQAGFSDDFIERSLVEFQNQRATNPNAKVVEKNLPDSEPGRSMKPAQPGISVSMSPYKVLEAHNKELLQKLHKTNLNSKEGVAGVNQLRDWARANGIEQRHVGAWISDIQNWQKKYGVPENPDAQSSATRAPLGTEVKAPQPARKEAAPASSSPSGFSQEQRKLLGTDHTNLLDSEFDEYMKQIENLQNMSVRGKEFGGFDINEAERKGLVSKLIEIRKERKARVKAKRLPALTAPHTKATAPKAELGEQLVEQAAERETIGVPRETANVPQAEIDEAAHEAATSPRNELPEPTEAQIEAGNYKKGHISIHGLDVTIENPKGSTRSGVGEGGKKWSVKMSAHYGYVRRTEGADGEQIDVYIGDKPESSKAFVVDQVDPKTGKFDEHKVILGAESQSEAEKLYDAHFDDKSGPSRRQNVTEMSVDRFKEWLKTEDNTKPVSEKSPTQASEAANNRPLPAKNSTRRIDGVIHVLDSVERVGDFDFELWESGVNGDLTMVTRDAETGDVVDGSVVIESNPKTAKKRFKDKVENARQALGEQSDGQVATAKPVASGETAGSAAVAESGEAEGKRDASTAFPDTRSSLESVFDDWVDSEVDAPKEIQPKREKSPTQPAKTRTEAKPATVKTKTGIKESNAKFAALFGQKTVKPGPPASRKSPVFDQAIYDQAKPLFEERLALSKGMDDATALRALLDSLKEEYGNDALPIIIGMKPYILHFMEERKGVVSTQEATDERSITSTESGNLARSDGRGSVAESGTIENTSKQSKKENGGKSGSSPDGNTSRRKRGRLRSQTASLFADDELQSSDESSRVEGDKQLAKVEEQTEPIAAAEAVVQAAAENVEPEPVPEVAEPEPKPKPVKTKPQPLSVLTGASFAITPEIADRIRSGGAVTKYKQNIDAVKTMRQIVMEGRRATVEEQEAMALYAGFGGIKDLFAPPYQNYKEAQRWYERQKELKELIGEDAYKMASASTKNAHFTDPQIVDRMWTIAEKLGFTKGRMLEPSMGSGNFFGLVPAHLRDKTTFTGVELDKTTGQMAQLLYPDANIHVQGFEDFNAPDNFFDLAMGNVPFGEYRISDNRYNKLLPQIHNYFFLKALDKVRPGGLVMFITSTGTMDSKRGEVVRKELAKQADLVTAIRFPAETFGKTALTSVVTDLIILRKRMPGEEAGDSSWIGTSKVADPRGPGYEPIQINDWMAANRQNMLGDFNGENRMYPGRANVDRTDDFEQRFTDAIAALPSDIMSDYTASVRVLAREAGVKFKEGGYVVRDGQLMQNVSGGLVEVEGTPDRIRRVEGLIAVRDAFDALIDGEMGRAPMGTARKDLNSAYDKFFGKYGSINDKKNREAMAGDPDLPRLMALESYDPKKKTTKKQPIFTKATVVGSRAFSKPENVQEGVIKSFQMRGEIILSQIADDLGLDEQTVAEEMVAKKIAFQTPQGNWELAAHYLSGNVRRKLAEAKVAVASDSFYQANVDALEDVVPRDIQHTQIAVEMGAPWMEPDVISHFVAELFQDSPSNIQVHYDRNLGLFTVSMDRSKAKLSSQAITTWGTSDVPFHELLDLALAGKTARVMEKYKDDLGIVREAFSPEKTQAANTKLDAIKKQFREWVWSNEERRTNLTNRYNDLFNSQVPAEYDVKFMLDEGGGGTVPGLASGWKLRNHQMAAVFRAVIEKRGLLAHEVGLGKTLAMIASASELKRMGIARKPAIAVPKKVLPAFANTVRAAFPLLKLHVVDSRDAQKRNTSMSQVATGEHDLVLMTHDNLDMLKMRPDFEAEMLQQELEEVNAVYNALKAEKGAGASSKRILKQIENRRAKLEAKINDALKSERKDDSISFEDTGIDFLFVDEFHKYKSLPVVTALGQVKGVPTGDSQRAVNMLMRARYLQQIQNGGGLIAATGTPVSNSLVEAWIMAKFLQPDLLEESGVQSFDAWVRQFAETVPALEMGATGEWKTVSRLSKFRNLPELQVMSRMTLDVKTAKETGILDVRPKRIDKVIQVPQTEAQAAYMQVLRERAEAVKRRDVEPWQDNYLVISSDGMLMASDPRLVLPGYKVEGGKIQALADNVLRVLKEKPGQTQMIFSDSGVSSNSWGFHLYGEIINKLVEGGIPRDKIIDFSKLDSDKKVETAVDRLNSGDALIAIGHRENMGTGVNAQEKMAAIHQFDVPWKPALVEQSEARGWRQGNTNKEIEILSYVTEGSFDAVKWSTVARKQQAITAFMQKPGEDTAREWEDGDDDTLSYDQIAAAASGDGDYLRKAELDAKVFKLSMMQQAHDSEALTRRQEIPRIVDRIAAMERRAVKVEREATAAKVIKDKEFAYQNAKKETIEDRKDVAKDISSAYLFSKDKHEKTVLGYYKGLRLMDDGWGNSYIELPIEGSETEHVSFNVNTTEFSGTLQSIERKISGLASDVDAKHIKETVIPGLQEDLAKLQAVTDTPFPFTEQLQKARAQSAAVNKRLQAKEAESAEEGEPLQADGVDVRAVSALGRQLRRDLREKAIKPSDVAGILEKRLPEIEAAAKDQMEVWKAFQRRKAEDFLAEMDNDTGIAGIAITAKSASKIQAAYDPEIDAPSSMPPPASRRTRESVESSPEFKKLSDFLGSSSVARNVIANLDKSDVDSLEGHAQSIADLLKGSTVASESNSFVNVPLSVMPHVLKVTENPEVLRAIVSFLPVDVVNFFVGKKLAPKHFLRDKAMLEHVLSVYGKSSVSPLVNEAVTTSLIRSVANTAAKVASLARGTLKADVAGLALSDDSVFSTHRYKSITDNPNFSRWFGQSKVVDQLGKPMPLYHGTQARNEIEAVDPSRFLTGSHFGPGFYMAESPEIASKGYAEGHLHPRGQESAGTPSVYKLYAKIENPLDVNKPAEPKMIAAAFGSPNVDLEEMGFGSRPTNEVMYKQLAKRMDDDKAAVNQKLQEMGYDGITRLNRASDESPEHREWVVFDPRQVKSATGNRGTFDESSNLSTSRRTEGGPASKLANPMDVLLYQQTIVKDRGSRGARMYVNDHARAILGASLTEVFGNDYSNVNAINLSREEVKKVADYLATEAKGLDGDYRAGAEGFVADLRELLSKNKTQRTFNIVDVTAYEARHESGIRSDQERAAENLKGDIREEGFHWSQREVSGQSVALVGASWAQSSKGFGKYRKALLKLEYPDDAETLAAETAAKIAAGKFDDLGIRTEADHEQAQNWLASYFERVAEKHGIEALEKFDRLLPKAKEAKAKGAQSVKERLRERIEQEQAQSGGTNRPRAPGGESQRVRGTDEGRQENGAQEVRRRSAEEPFESAEPVKGPQLTIDERTNAENVRRPGEEAPEFSSVKAGANIQPNLFGKAETAEGWVDPLDPESVEQTTLFGKDGMPKKTWGDMWANLADVLNLPKALRASGDLSAAGRQGWFLSIPPSRWAIAARSFGKGVRSSEAMGLKKGAYKALKRELTQHPVYKDMTAAGWIPMTSDSGELTAQTELFGSRFAGKIPWAKYSEQAYKMNLDFLALSTFELYKKGIDKSSRDLRERHEGYKAAVDWINVSSGRGSYSGRFGKWYKEKPAPFLNVIGWAPGLVYSRMQLLNPVTYAKNLKNPQSRVVFRKQMSELFQSGAVLFLIGAMAKAGGALISTDPDKADFLKIRFGTTRYDVLAGLQQVARLGIRMGEWARTRATEDGSDEASQKKLKKSANETTSALLRFGRTKLGPVPGFFIDWLNDWKKVTGERHAPGDFIGDFKEGENLRGIAEMTEDPIVSQVIPLFWADMVQAYEQGWRANGREGALTHAAKMLPSGLGIGIQDYDRPEWSERAKLHLDAFDLDPRFPTRKTGEREGDYQKRVRSHMAEQEKAIEQFADDPNLIGQPLERKKALLKQEMSDEGRARLKKIAPEDVADDRMVRAWIQIGVDRLKANPVYQQMSEMEQKHALQSYYGRMNRYKAQPANGQHEYLRPDTVDENVLQEKIKAAISSQQDN